MVDLEVLSVEQALALDLVWPDVYFHPGYGRAEEIAGNGVWRCVIGGDGEWLVPFHTKEDDLASDAYSPYGYSGVYADVRLTESQRSNYWAATLSALRRAEVVSLFLRQTPLFPSPFTQSPGQTVVASHQTFVLRLGDPDMMWAAMEGRARTSIRKAQRAGFAASVRCATTHDLVDGADFRKLYQGAMERRAAGSRYYFPDSYYLCLAEGLADGLKISEVRNSEGSVVASALFFVHRELMHYHLSGGTPEAGRSGATNLLIWAAAQAGAELGAKRLHLGGGIANGDGLARFKRSFGGETLMFDAFGVVVDEGCYASAVASRSGEDESEATFFPAYRRP